MHVAATAPLSLSPDDLDPAAIEKERAVLTEQAKESGKPGHRSRRSSKADPQVPGRSRAAEASLRHEPGPDRRAAGRRHRQGTGFDADTVKGFTRLALGEGVEKLRQDDFAAEVASMTGQA
jgi:elongation factor Ts